MVADRFAFDPFQWELQTFPSPVTVPSYVILENVGAVLQGSLC